MIASRFKPASVSRLKTILRFEEQNLNWNLNDYTHQTNALAYGLKEAKIVPNAKALIWLDDKHTAELATVLMGCLKAGVHTVSLHDTLSSLDNESTSKTYSDLIAKENPDLIILSPNQKFENKKKIEWLYEALPQLEQSSNHRRLNVQNVSNLKHIIHTGFYEKKGTIKFRDFLLYRDRNLSNHDVLDYKNHYEKALSEGSDLLADVNELDHVYYAGDFQNFAAVRKMILGSTLAGYFMNMLSKDFIHRSDLKHINDVSEDIRCHIVVDKSTDQALRERVTRGNVNYIKL